ncbi:hypothetical protein Rumeso_04484 [Rubellimicrobium mesophilum DSM 19309]|uniref:Uncharacterized protein n=1 Tax=Rubellimicrobium mesophilum DSM 19309 TaxID=442562 RepID=A0A017HHA7_9RHOB|nr:hypothetical protein [Rubellimicrobium mesophilum]EYD73887.1 hypothetical protein Rumeso_04484 [Rubellimicrobium mesophilum DSM 19309]
MPADPHDDLSHLLEEERALILSGGWAGLRALAPRKERCLRSLEADPERLGPLAAGLARNQALLRAALDGLRDATRRRAALASARRGLVTYTASGTRAELPTAPPRFERKA